MTWLNFGDMVEQADNIQVLCGDFLFLPIHHFVLAYM